MRPLRLWQRCFPVNFAKFPRTPFLRNTSRLLLLDTGPPFADKDHNHKLKNLKIITNNKFRKLWLKCLNYWENWIADFEKAKESLITGIRSCLQSWYNKHGVTTLLFFEWKKAVISASNEKIIHLTTKLKTENIKNTLGLRDKATTEELKLLRNKFVVVPIDEAGSIVPLSFKGTMLKFYSKSLSWIMLIP